MASREHCTRQRAQICVACCGTQIWCQILMRWCTHQYLVFGQVILYSSLFCSFIVSDCIHRAVIQSFLLCILTTCVTAGVPSATITFYVYGTGPVGVLAHLHA